MVNGGFWQVLATERDMNGAGQGPSVATGGYPVGYCFEASTTATTTATTGVEVPVLTKCVNL